MPLMIVSHWNLANQTFYASISIAGSHISHGKQVKGALQLHPGIPGNAAFANPIIVAHCCSLLLIVASAVHVGPNQPANT